MNLRGDVVTVLDLRSILGTGRTSTAAKVCNVILNIGGERTGLLVDRIAEVVKARRSEIHAPPANLPNIHARYLQGVFNLQSELLAVLDIREVLDATTIAC
jgi:purine-binding chemotaxis protein CheW